MSNIIMRYEDYLIHTKHASDNTVASYMRDLRQYASYLGSEGIDVLDADQDVVSGYMNSMKANGKSAATISRALASIKSLYIFAVQNREIEENPIHNIKIDKAEKKLPQILTGKEVELLLQQPKVTEMKGCRDKAMLEVLYATGIRVSELIGLNIDDVSLPGSLDSTQFSAHKLRHTAATLMLSNGVDLKTLQEVLGHENLNTTQIYTHIESTELKIAAEANPLSHLALDSPDTKSEK